MEIYIDDKEESIIFKKYHRVCIFCGSEHNLINFKNKLVCHQCYQNLLNIVDSTYQESSK